MPFEEALDYIKELGLEAVEIGTGAYPGDAHCKPAELLKSDSKLKAFKQAIDRRGLAISALSCHGNPIHPDGKLAKSHDAIFRNTVELYPKAKGYPVLKIESRIIRNINNISTR